MPLVKCPQRLTLETSNFVHGSTMRSFSLVMSECLLSGCGQGHVSNFYIVDLDNFATASRRYTGDIHNSTAVSLFMTPIRQWKRLTRHGWVHIFTTHRPTLTHQLYNFDLFRTCRTSSFCTVACQLARFQLRRRIARSLGDSWVSCFSSWYAYRRWRLLQNWIAIPQRLLPRQRIFFIFGCFRPIRTLFCYA